MNIAYRASKFFGNAAHRDALGDPFPDSVFLTVREFWNPPGTTGVSISLYDGPSDGQGIVQRVFLGEKSGYDRQAAADKVFELYLTGICFIDRKSVV